MSIWSVCLSRYDVARAATDRPTDPGWVTGVYTDPTDRPVPTDPGWVTGVMVSRYTDPTDRHRDRYRSRCAVLGDVWWCPDIPF